MNRGVIESVEGKLQREEPQPGTLRQAAVSIILRGEESPSVLLIKRADREGDPWSGQIAFPGGKKAPEDTTARGTAERETREEVGIDLARNALFLGYGPMVKTHTGTMDVVPVVFSLGKDVVVKENVEVASHRWVPLGNLLSPLSRSSYKMEFGGKEVELPAYAVDDYIVWGLTYRIISSIFDPDNS